tara:strand:- start:1051 stop:1893 length:843 start_codon:yes stop_codon:yes gene_type:complete
MEDTQSSELASEVTPQEGLENSESTQSLNGLVEQAASQENNVEQQEELSALQQDKRYSEFWNEDPNKMYDHIKHLESKQSESQQTVKDLESLRQERDNLSEQLTSYNSALEDPTVGPIYQQALADANTAIAKSKYGDLPQEVLNKLTEKDNDTQNLYQMYEQQAQEIQHFKNKEIANLATDSITKKAQEYGIDPKLPEFFDYAKSNNLDPQSYEQAWVNMALPQLLEGAAKKAIEANSQANKETQKGSVYSPTTNQVSNSNEPRRTLKATLEGILANNRS